MNDIVNEIIKAAAAKLEQQILNPPTSSVVDILVKPDVVVEPAWEPENPHPSDPTKCRCGATKKDSYCYCGC